MCCDRAREQVRKLQSQGRRGGDAAGSTVGRGDGGSPAVKEAKKVELAAWLAAEIEVGAPRYLNCCVELRRLLSAFLLNALFTINISTQCAQ